MIGYSYDKTNFPHKLLLSDRQSKIVQSEGFPGSLLGTLL